jgi:WD40 repeat protein
MRVVGHCRLGLAVRLALLAVLVGAPQAWAQDRSRIDITPQIPHTDMIFSVAFSPDGTRLLSGSEDGTLKLWDAASGLLIRTLEGHAGSVKSVVFSSDGTRIVSGAVVPRSGSGTQRMAATWLPLLAVLVASGWQ